MESNENCSPLLCDGNLLLYNMLIFNGQLSWFIRSKDGELQ